MRLDGIFNLSNFYARKLQIAKEIVKIFGRENLVLENEYLIKYKGPWR
jgi:hypothetical protein